MDYHRHLEDPVLIDTTRVDDLESVGSASAAGVDSLANNRSDVMLLCNETTWVSPE